jgi:hypothetical protein
MQIYSSDRDRAILEEHFGLRYTAIPYTVLFAETRFQQESTDHFEGQTIGDGFDMANDFVRDTDATADLKDYRVGASISPWQRVSFHATGRRKLKQNDYDHEIDTDLSPLSGNGYPSFIRTRDIDQDELELKLVVHWVPRFKTTLKYQIISTDYRTTTDPGIVTFFDPFPVDVTLPGGNLLAANLDSHVYSFGATLTPWRRLYLSTTLSYTDSKIVSGVNNGTSSVAYSGDIYSALASANFVLSKATDWHANYSFSRGDYEQSSSLDRVPFGLLYERHAVTTGLTRRFKKNITTRLEYGFFRYDEGGGREIADYTAHAVLATLNIRFGK